MKKISQLISFEFGNTPVLGILIFPEGSANLDSYLKTYKPSKTQGFFQCERFNDPRKLNNKGLPSHEAFHNKLQNCSPFEKDYLDDE